MTARDAASAATGRDDRDARRPEYRALARSLAAVLRADFGVHTGRRTIIGVAGESGSGKSTTATALAREFADDGLRTEVLYQDDYFRRPPRANHAHRLLDLAHVGPHEVDLDRIATHAADFRAARDGVVVPAVDYAADAFRTRVVDFGALDVLVVEGTYVLTLADLDVRVFLEATYADTRARRVARARDVDSPFVERVLAIEHAIVARQGAVADVVIDRAFAVRRRL
ncbi:hypothetical protein tb265_22320 [Gemmatimonadetes bacterium T265]|nr:hypothetical protein tb265_22320 [Gemmatimonadetes bacterium T265]